MGNSGPIRLAAVQLPGCTMDLVANVSVAVAAVRQAASEGAKVIALPELATMPYFCGDGPVPYRAWAEEADGSLAKTFSALAAETVTALFVPFYERDSQTGFYHNSVLGFGPTGASMRGGPVARKMHLPVGDSPPPGYDERAHFQPGDRLYVVETCGLKIGVLVCYDRRFPEAWRALRGLGADLVVVPVAGSGGDDMDFFIGELRTHARENGLAVLCANKVGDEHVGGTTVDNYGFSTVIGADGTLLGLRRREAGPGLVMSDLDVSRIREIRRELRYYDDRRHDLSPV